MKFSYMLGGTVFDRVSSINDLRVIMAEKMTFSEHMDVMVAIAKEFAMLGFIRRLSLEFISLYSLHFSGSSKTGIRKLRVERVI
jgi:hypothetical protein